ncbi:PEP/pyruvate-binding domain-containing protein [Kribbella sp. NPDC051952]|uniref:PEP/pyruvate-binding domain-containing protein n=1 Tax=Kribbella sp. NPDC051952 TaxID=3154851 RepID=UPI003421A435
MLIPLAAATADTCGGKAGGLGALIRAHLPVPDGIVVPYDGEPLVDELGRWLEAAGDPVVAVRSSAANEDTTTTSAAGQHDSFLRVQGVAAVVEAVRACRASLWTPRAIAYRDGADCPSMAVIVQRQVDGEVSGVMFTPADPGGDTLIEAAWGLGPNVVEGRVTPDAYRVAADDSVTRTIVDEPTLTDETAVRLAHLGYEVAAVQGSSQDIEWTVADGHLWLLQSRPVTAPPPPGGASTGTPGSHGTATGPARIVRGPGDFRRVRPGDILVCRFTDPAWTPLLRIVAGVVTEIGGVLSHAAIVAREQHIPAVLGVPDAMTYLADGEPVTIDGSTGIVSQSGARGGTRTRTPGGTGT